MEFCADSWHIKLEQTDAEGKVVKINNYCTWYIAAQFVMFGYVCVPLLTSLQSKKVLVKVGEIWSDDLQTESHMSAASFPPGQITHSSETWAGFSSLCGDN